MSIIIFRVPPYAVFVCRISIISYARAGIPPNIYIITNIPSRNYSINILYFRTAISRYGTAAFAFADTYAARLRGCYIICYTTYPLPFSIYAFRSSYKNEYPTRSSL